MNVEHLEDGYVKLTVNGGKVRDIRTNRKYKTVVCIEQNMKYFEVA
jgi:hypothetical protein